MTIPFQSFPRTVALLLALLLGFGVGAHALQAQGTPADARFFAQTGQRVDNDVIWNYFQARGGVDTFGYPVSPLMSYQGFPVQVFQRHVLQVNGPEARPLNLLDPDVMPLTTLNGSTFPAHSSSVAASAPAIDDLEYGLSVQQHLEALVPDSWEGEPVGFLRYYLSAAPTTPSAMRGLVALEVWGFPTSEPARDPANHDFIYQRFQRGILHFDAASGTTRGILLGDAFKGRTPGLLGAPPAAPTPPPLPTTTAGRFPKAQASGFVISVVADSAARPIVHPTGLTWDEQGALYVSRMEGEVVRVAPNGTRTTFADGLDVPLGVAFRPGTDTLFVSHRGGVTMLRDSDADGVADEREPFLTGLPCCYAELHQTNGISFGPDGWLYIAQGAMSDHGKDEEVAGEPWHASILRAHPDRGQASLERVATGVRNPYDVTVRADGAIFATDNATDNGPPDELNHILPGQSYGWPYCFTTEQGEVAAFYVWNEPARCVDTRAAVATLLPHSSANGVAAYDAALFPASYRGDLFVALWSHIEGAHRVVHVDLAPDGESFSTTLAPFVTDMESPLDVAVGPDGALYIADWGPGRIYRVGYQP